MIRRILLILFFPALVTAQPCSDLFISEYVEGSSFNKVIEIYNPTTGTITMDGYQLLLYSNGATNPSFSFKLHGLLESQSVYLISHPQADSLLVLPFADTTGLICNWNGNDAIVLVNNNSADTLDIIGVIGIDPGTSWSVPGGTTADHSLVRTMETQDGTVDWLTGSQQWTSFDQNDFSHLGSHEIVTCPIANPEISVSVDSTSLQESAGSFQLKVSILNPNTGVTSGDLKVTGGSATQGSDYFFQDQTVTFPANAFEPILVAIDLVNDGISEPDESIEISLQNATNDASIGADLVVIKITDDDATGIIKPLEPNVKMFPNPASDVLNIESKGIVNRIVIENIHGNKAVSFEGSFTDLITLPLLNLPPGMYVVHIYFDNHVTTDTILKH